jgi:hypothetical protein
VMHCSSLQWYQKEREAPSGVSLLRSRSHLLISPIPKSSGLPPKSRTANGKAEKVTLGPEGRILPIVSRQGKARLGVARHGAARLGWARRGFFYGPLLPASDCPLAPQS